MKNVKIHGGARERIDDLIYLGTIDPRHRYDLVEDTIRNTFILSYPDIGVDKTVNAFFHVDSF
jgi:hypothetical protein